MTRLPIRQLGVLALIAILLAAMLAVYVGSRQQKLPAPFGVAANGVIPFSRDGDIHVGDPLLGTTRLVLGGPEYDSGASFSPDGTRIAFLRTASPTGFDVYAVRPDGSDLRRVTAAPISNLVWAQWAPDSRHVAVISKVDATANRCVDSVCPVNRLEMFDAVGSEPVETIAMVKGMDYVQFRPPEGGELLYRALVDGRWGLFAMDADGANARPIVPPTVPTDMDATFGAAVYSPDGERIYFDQYTLDASFGDPGCCQLFVVNADGSDLHRFVPRTSDGVWDGHAVVSPDGTRIAFWHNIPDQPTQRVTVIPTDGTGRMIETGPELSGGAQWIWAPDSSKILMFPNDVASGTAYLLDPAGGPWTTVPWVSVADLDWQRLAP
jgi:Tol biopolymer transport system component